MKHGFPTWVAVSCIWVSCQGCTPTPSKVATTTVSTTQTAARHLGLFAGGLEVDYELRDVHQVSEAARAPEFANWALLHAGITGFSRGDGLGYYANLNLGVGATIAPFGLAYSLGVHPFGLALRHGRNTYFGLALGAGALGAVDTIDDIASAGLELRSRVSLGSAMGIGVRSHLTWALNGEPERGPSLPFGDLFDVALLLDFGTANRYAIGAEYRELFGREFAGLVVRYSFNTGGRW